MNTNENPLKFIIIFKNLWTYIKIHQNHLKFTKNNETPKLFSYERCSLNQVISEIKIPFKHALNVISCDCCVWYRKEEKIFRHSWTSPPRIFKKHQSQNWSSYYVSNLKCMKPLINRENARFVFLTTNHFFSSSRRVQVTWIGFIASTPS